MRKAQSGIQLKRSDVRVTFRRCNDYDSSLSKRSREREDEETDGSDQAAAHPRTHDPQNLGTIYGEHTQIHGTPKAPPTACAWQAEQHSETDNVSGTRLMGT